MKKIMLTGLTVAMVVGGSTAAFADGKGKGNDRDHGRDLDKFDKVKANVNVNFNFNFNDVRGGDVEWALRYIASLASRHVFDGYEDGTFRPRAPITRIEAIKAAVSTMGLGDKAQTPEEMNAHLNFKDADKIPAWAVGYVAVAVENDLFVETDDTVQPNKPADRLWFTTLMVKALSQKLNLENEIKAGMNAQLPFRDADKIPAGSVGYVKVAVDHQLISGYEDNTFRPNQPVTRAEAAKLLDLTGDQIGDQDAISGTVSAAVYGNVLTITRNGQSSTYTLQQYTPVFRNNALVTPGDLKIGDGVKLKTYTVNNTQIVYFIEVTKPVEQNGSQFTVSGTYNFFGPNAQGQNTISITQNVNGVQTVVQYAVDPNVAFKTNGHAFAPGCTVQLTVQNQVVKQIEITAPAPSAS